jgi:hypothetical protein
MLPPFSTRPPMGTFCRNYLAFAVERRLIRFTVLAGILMPRLPLTCTLYPIALRILTTVRKCGDIVWPFAKRLTVDLHTPAFVAMSFTLHRSESSS